MEPAANDLDFFGADLTRAQDSEADRLPLVFDDEPLDHILYAEGNTGPTPAGMYARAGELLAEIRRHRADGDIEAVTHGLAMLAAEECPISTGTYAELAGLMMQLVPQIPVPILKFDLRPLRPLLERIWSIACTCNDNALLKKSAAPLYRWYEHHMFYEEARRVLSGLLEVLAREGNRPEEAVVINNLAFEYLLEGRYQEAIPGFERAAVIFEEVGEYAQSANSRANYWTCRFDRGESISFEEAEPELYRLSEVLGRACFWQVRKPLVLLARLAELRGEIPKAVDLARQAVAAGERSGTRYPEIDSAYLQKLLEKGIDA